MAIAPSEFLRSCFLAGVAAVKPDRLFSAETLAPTIGTRPISVLAIGKAAGEMAAAIEAALVALGRTPQASLVIGTGQPGEHFAGDHPLPGPASRRAAAAVANWIARLPDDIDVHVALSGGASSLIAAPVPGIEADQLEQFFARLLRAGLDIAEMNCFRKRVTQWSAGRLAASLAPRRVIGWIISDVPGDDPADVGSGPLSPDRVSVGEACALLKSHRLWDSLSPAFRGAMATETLKPGAKELTRVELHIVACNSDALAAAARFATGHGVRVHSAMPPLHGEAALAGARIAHALVATRRLADSSLTQSPEIPELWLYGGECVVALDGNAPPGGRNQELALAAARELATGKAGSGTTMLSAGTDGRDGTTDVAGAVVDGETWGLIHASGRDPAADLAAHDAHQALSAVGATWATGATATNVMDVVLALRSQGLIGGLQR